MANQSMDKYKYGEVSNSNLKLVVAMRRSLQTEERYLTALLNEYGLTMSQFGVLESLYHIGPMNIKDIIEKSLSSSGNMTVVIRNLTKQNYITKERDADDGRAFIISITEEGHSLIEKIFPKHLVKLEEAFSGLEANEKDDLLVLLKKLNKY